MVDDASSTETQWTLITNHGAVLVYVADNPEHTVREIGDAVGITERTAARILRELRDAGYISAQRQGRRNIYQLNPSRPLRHPVGEDKQVSDLLRGLVEADQIRRVSRNAGRRARR